MREHSACSCKEVVSGRSEQGHRKGRSNTDHIYIYSTIVVVVVGVACVVVVVACLVAARCVVAA